MSKRIRISNETVNCYGTWIRTDGIDLTQFRRNPVLLWMHNRGEIIGEMRNIEVAGGEVTGEPWFDEVLESSKLAKRQWELGTLRMGSPRFEIVETSDDSAQLKQGQTRPTVTKCRLVEYSMVDIGGNDDNIVLSLPEGKVLTLAAGEPCDELPLLKTNKPNPNTDNMEELKKVALMLGLAETATLQDVQNQLGILAGYQKANETLRKELADMETQMDELKLAGVTTLVEAAIEAGKIGAPKKEYFINLGKQIGEESLKELLNNMHAPQKPTTILQRSVQEPTNSEWKKLSDVPAKDLKLMRTDNPEEYRRLYKAEYGIECPTLE